MRPRTVAVAMVASMSKPSNKLLQRRLRRARWLLRHYPFPRGAWRIAGVVVGHSLAGRPALSEVQLAEALPAGEIIRCAHDVRLRVARDAMFVQPYLLGEYERWPTRVFCRILRPGDTVVDVGANFGWYSAVMARQVGPTGVVHAFEPLPSTWQQAREVIALNDPDSRVILNRTGLGETAGLFTVYTFAGLPHGHASTTSLGRNDATPNRCEVTTLDQYCEETGIEMLDFVKIDVEGHELEVLRGAPRMLERSDAPIVSFEVNEACLRERKRSSQELQHLLHEYGYRHIWSIDNRREVIGPLPETTGDYLAAKAARADVVEEALEKL